MSRAFGAISIVKGKPSSSLPLAPTQLFITLKLKTSYLLTLQLIQHLWKAIGFVGRLSLFPAFLFLSCERAVDCTEAAHDVEVESSVQYDVAAIPDSLALGDSLWMPLHIEFSECRRHPVLQHQQLGYEIEIKGKAKVANPEKYEGCQCSDEVKLKDAPCLFSPSKRGTYHVSIWYRDKRQEHLIEVF